MLLSGKLGLALALIAAPLSAQREEANLHGNWSGSYRCAQGQTDVRIEIAQDGRNGRFDFSAAMASGSYRFIVEAGRGDDIILRPTRWERQPPGYVMVPAIVRLTGNRMSGRIDSPACGAINVTRDEVVQDMARNQPRSDERLRRDIRRDDRRAIRQPGPAYAPDAAQPATSPIVANPGSSPRPASPTPVAAAPPARPVPAKVTATAADIQLSNDIAAAVATSFFNAHADRARQVAAGILSAPQAIRDGWIGWGYSVKIDLDGKANLLAGFPQYGRDAYSETFEFFVNTSPGPRCSVVKGGRSCTFDLYVRVDTQDMLGEVGGYFRDVLTGKSNDLTWQEKEDIARYGLDAKITAEVAEYHAAKWAPVSATFTQSAAGLKSVTLDAAMRKEVARLTADRNAAIHRRSVAMDALFKSVNNSASSLCGSIGAGAMASGKFSMTDSLWYRMSC